FNHIEKYNIKPVISKVFNIGEISKAHLLMESNNANGKIVVLV
ncbi:MAG: zinc-binding dehydrogenase, partial [Fusobacteriaceae bacterium]|nr:zinc-binding dehydrogenase [Fusobacteriaceae bacterium]